MAHECPDCGCQCHCGGDIDDCLLNLAEDVAGCTHCECRKCGMSPHDCECFQSAEEEDDFNRVLGGEG